MCCGDSEVAVTLPPTPSAAVQVGSRPTGRGRNPQGCQHASLQSATRHLRRPARPGSPPYLAGRRATLLHMTMHAASLELHDHKGPVVPNRLPPWWLPAVALLQAIWGRSGPRASPPSSCGGWLLAQSNAAANMAVSFIPGWRKSRIERVTGGPGRGSLPCLYPAADLAVQRVMGRSGQKAEQRCAVGLSAPLWSREES